MRMISSPRAWMLASDLSRQRTIDILSFTLPNWLDHRLADEKLNSRLFSFTKMGPLFGIGFSSYKKKLFCDKRWLSEVLGLTLVLTNGRDLGLAFPPPDTKGGKCSKDRVGDMHSDGRPTYRGGARVSACHPLCYHSISEGSCLWMNAARKLRTFCEVEWKGKEL